MSILLCDQSSKEGEDRPLSFFPVMANDNEDRSPVVIGVCVFLIVVALVATGLRIYARRLVNLNLWWDDWLCIIGLVRRRITI